MKVIAIILSACMLMLNTGDLLNVVNMHAHEDEAVMACCQDTDSGCCNSDDSAEDQERSCQDDHNCSPGCHCSCGIHITALVYDFTEPDGMAVQSYDYGNYLNSYTFEFSGDFLQPPRLI